MAKFCCGKSLILILGVGLGGEALKTYYFSSDLGGEEVQVGLKAINWP